LKISYPTLFSIAQQPDAWVADHMQYQDGRLQWDVIFTRPVQDWEMEMVLSFFEQLYSLTLRQGEDDRMIWSLSKKGIFEVKSFYTRLITRECLPFPWKSIWRVKAPARVAFFVWTAALGKILTMDNLRKRNVMVVEWCCLCKKSGESIDHLLLHCEVARDLWVSIYKLFGVVWVMPRRVIDVLNSWGGQVGYGPVREVWKLVPLCLWWCLWRERNARTFEDVELSEAELRKFVLHTLYSWMVAHHSLLFASFVDFLTFCHSFSLN
jgi:hypothetical protein